MSLIKLHSIPLLILRHIITHSVGSTLLKEIIMNVFQIFQTIFSFFKLVLVQSLDWIHKRRQKFFANYYFYEVSPQYELRISGEKRLLFQKLREQKSKIPKFEKNGSIRIVELGAGSGTNLEYYPENCSLLVVDPNPFFEPYFRNNLKKHSGINFEDYKVAYGENMDFVEDESVDAVVVTSVNCSVSDVQKVYKEIQRILVPGGKFYYLEHILGKPGSWSYYKQKFMAFLQIWTFIFCNCHVDRDLDYQITLAGFSNIEQRIFQLDTKNLYFTFHFVVPHVTGIATK